MDFESNDEINSENTHIDLNGSSGGLVDAHFGLGDFLGSDATSCEPNAETSVSSGSPPSQEWQNAWMDASLEPQAASLAADPMLFDFSTLNSMGMGVNLSMPELFTNHSSNYQFMLNPSDLHKVPAQLPQNYSHVPPQTIVPGREYMEVGPEDDIIAAVKRLTGITSAQVAGAPSDFAPDLRDLYSVPQGFSDNSCSSASSDRSSMPPQGSDMAHAVTPSEENSPTEMTIGPSGRPKTAHTTIERRYRTNLNTCITNLRNSIPAIRYLDKQYQKESAVPDTLDENGCVDGVKAARKISKATIMGKAREYIVVLKKRELKRQRELEGMKELVSSLVGGPILLQEWERQWAARQAQEVDDEMDGDDMDSADEDDEDSADERPRKRVKTAPAPPPAAKLKKPSPRPITAAGATSMNEEAKVPKKRGRPPKNNAPRQSISMSPTAQLQFGAAMAAGDVKPNLNPQSMQTTYTFVPSLPQQQRKPAYLLASFVFMSFFKPSSRMPTHEHEHSHSGTVLSSGYASERAMDNAMWHSHPALHMLHTAVMVVLFVALAFSLAPQSAQSKIWAYLTNVFGHETTTSEKGSTDIPASLLEDPSSVMALAEKELKEPAGNPKLKAKLYNALQTSAGSTPTSDQLGVTALLHFSVKPSQAITMWKQAAALCSATSNVRSAYTMPLPRAVDTVKHAGQDTRSPLTIIASKVIEEQIERMLCDMFVNEVVAVCQTSESDSVSATGPESSASRRAKKELIQQAREVGGKPAEIVMEWDLALSGKLAKDGETSGSAVKSLLKVLSLMRRIFPDSGSALSRDDSTMGLPSPPPSPLLQEEAVKMERILRIALDSKIFHGYHGSNGSIVTEGEVEKEKERERSEDVRKARDLLVTRLSQAARMRRLAALDGEDRD